MSTDALPFRCDVCGEPACFVAPGDAPVRELFLLHSGEPARCWCLVHWRVAFGQAREAHT